MRRIMSILFAWLTMTLLPIAAHAQSADRAWNTQCKSNACTLSKKLQSQQNKSVVATFFLVVERNADTIRVGSIIPLGVAVQPGIRFVANGQNFEVPVDVCYPDGCRAQREFTNSEVSDMTAAADLQIQFFPYGQDAPLFVRLPTRDLAAAIRNAQESFN